MNFEKGKKKEIINLSEGRRKMGRKLRSGFAPTSLVFGLLYVGQADLNYS